VTKPESLESMCHRWNERWRAHEAERTELARLIGNALRERRSRAGLAASRMSLAVGMNAAYVHQVETTIARLTPERAAKLDAMLADAENHQREALFAGGDRHPSADSPADE